MRDSGVLCAKRGSFRGTLCQKSIQAGNVGKSIQAGNVEGSCQQHKMWRDCGLEPFAMKLEFKMMRIRCFSILDPPSFAAFRSSTMDEMDTASTRRHEHVKDKPLDKPCT